jgi:hypothetical protein
VTVYTALAKFACAQAPISDVNRTHRARGWRVILRLQGNRAMGSAHFKRLGAGAFILVLAHLCAPDSATADCGHGVRALSDSLITDRVLDQLIVSGTWSPALLGAQDMPAVPFGPAGRSPCSGLSCSGRAPLPPSTASAGTDGLEQWVAVAECFVMITSSGRRQIINRNEFNPTAPNSWIFHPPKSDSSLESTDCRRCA